MYFRLPVSKRNQAKDQLENQVFVTRDLTRFEEIVEIEELSDEAASTLGGGRRPEPIPIMR